jgi:VanW like protein
MKNPFRFKPMDHAKASVKPKCSGPRFGFRDQDVQNDCDNNLNPGMQYGMTRRLPFILILVAFTLAVFSNPNLSSTEARARALPIPKYLQARGVRYLFASGTSNFAGSPDFRVANIVNGARRLDGKVIEPGAIFDFNRAINGITEQNGFVLGYIIKNGTLEKDVGGGICQVSTTIFRAAYLGGLPIVERNWHSYRVHYYDPIGLEATVYDPWKNFKFRNDTGTPLYIRAFWNTRRKWLTFNLYGPRPDRSAWVSKATITRTVPPGPARFISDDKTRFGRTRLIDTAQPGFDLYVTRVVTFNTGRKLRDTTRSIYQPWGQIWGVHPQDRRLLQQKALEKTRARKPEAINTVGLRGTPVVVTLNR